LIVAQGEMDHCQASRMFMTIILASRIATPEIHVIAVLSRSDSPKTVEVADSLRQNCDRSPRFWIVDSERGSLVISFGKHRICDIDDRSSCHVRGFAASD
jgi:hypothetical protein